MAVKKKAAEPVVRVSSAPATLEKALADPKAVKALIDALGESGKLMRSESAEVIHEVAQTQPRLLSGYAPQLIDALGRPESQTRWEILGALEAFVSVDARAVSKAIEAATTALHDTESSVVREAAFRMLAAFGSTTARRSEQVWPLLDEALRCYHGDAEYPGMLSGLVRLLEGSATEPVRVAAAVTVSNDVNHPRAIIRGRARRITALAPKVEVPEEEAQ